MEFKRELKVGDWVRCIVGYDRIGEITAICSDEIEMEVPPWGHAIFGDSDYSYCIDCTQRKNLEPISNRF